MSTPLPEVALVSFFAALAGGALAFFGALVATRRQFVLEARAKILRDTLPSLHDPLHRLLVHMRETGEPQHQPDSMGDAYSLLVRDAIVAGHKDFEKVNPFWAVWDEVGEIHTSWSNEASVEVDRAKLLTLRDARFAEQLPKWERLDEILNEYTNWLKAVLTAKRRWW